ncbi:MAG TPA: 5-carboxymethyl-2-hydroxymuconate Delta-isomerase [Pyrinomonadaceae bacterium]|jgi:5-carboxymethyl-2-hydroxymuconate isomerase
MPHFVVDCSENVLQIHSPEEILRRIHDTAQASRLFKKGDIKVRIRAFEYHTVGEAKADFIHVFGNIMEGRTTEQKANLSRQIVTELKRMFPEVPVISINIREFEKATYSNRNLV